MPLFGWLDRLTLTARLYYRCERPALMQIARNQLGWNCQGFSIDMGSLFPLPLTGMYDLNRFNAIRATRHSMTQSDQFLMFSKCYKK